MFACILPVFLMVETFTPPSVTPVPAAARHLEQEDTRISATETTLPARGSMATSSVSSAPSASSASSAPSAPSERAPEDPFARRPVCSGMFLASDWQLTSKQRRCDLIQNRIFSSSALAGSVWSAATLPIWQGAVGRPRTKDGFPKRLAVNVAQNAFKSTGAYLGGMIQHEDPRQAPPFLVLRAATPRHGFAKRFWHAMVVNAMAYTCANPCATERDIRQRFAFSRVAGSLASGFSNELWESHRSFARGMRGAATAYGATFANSVFVEFKPELTALAGRLVSFF